MFVRSLRRTSGSHGNHDPDSADILRVLDSFYAKGKSALVSPRTNNLLAHLVAVDVSDDAVTVTVSELDREGLEGVTLRHVVLNAVLEFHGGEVSAPDSLEFVIGKRCR